MASVALAFCIVGCSGDPEIPEGHSADEIRKPVEGTMKAPGGGIEGPTKAGGN